MYGSFVEVFQLPALWKSSSCQRRRRQCVRSHTFIHMYTDTTYSKHIFITSVCTHSSPSVCSHHPRYTHIHHPQYSQNHHLSMHTFITLSMQSSPSVCTQSSPSLTELLACFSNTVLCASAMRRSNSVRMEVAKGMHC